MSDERVSWWWYASPVGFAVFIYAVHYLAGLEIAARRREEDQPCFMFRNEPRERVPARCFGDFLPDGRR